MTPISIGINSYALIVTCTCRFIAINSIKNQIQSTVCCDFRTLAIYIIIRWINAAYLDNKNLADNSMQNTRLTRAEKKLVNDLNSSVSLKQFSQIISTELKKINIHYWALIHLDLPPCLAYERPVGRLNVEYKKILLSRNFHNYSTYSKYVQFDQHAFLSDIVKVIEEFPFTNEELESVKNTYYEHKKIGANDSHYINVIKNSHHNYLFLTTTKEIEQTKFKSIVNNNLNHLLSISKIICSSGIKLHTDYFVDHVTQYNNNKLSFSIKLLKTMVMLDMTIYEVANHFDISVTNAVKELKRAKKILSASTLCGAYAKAKSLQYI